MNVKISCFFQAGKKEEIVCNFLGDQDLTFGCEYFVRVPNGYQTDPQCGHNIEVTFKHCTYLNLKVASFQKVRCVCQISKINIPNHYPELEI